MFDGNTVGVIVPAFNEEKLLGKTLQTMPDFVDVIIVVNDGSSDGTAEVIEEHKKLDNRLVCITHHINQGVGQTLIDGYVKARELKVDIAAIMAGDAQMDPNDLPALLYPISEGLADYTKGNRLLVEDVAEHMPTHRLIGNSFLTFLTKFATGYWHVMDPQSGYTAISGRALKTIPIERMIKGYGYPADILNMLNLHNFRVADVEVRPVYGEEQSYIKLRSFIPKVSSLLVRLFFRRLIKKYLIRDFNPLCLSYLTGLALLMFVAFPFALKILYNYFWAGYSPEISMLIFMLGFLSGLQILLSAIQYDMEDNRRLAVHVEHPGYCDTNNSNGSGRP
jgi:glycosyltransferase involved in cell wall biosynthesis